MIYSSISHFHLHKKNARNIFVPNFSIQSYLTLHPLSWFQLVFIKTCYQRSMKKSMWQNHHHLLSSAAHQNALAVKKRRGVWIFSFIYSDVHESTPSALIAGRARVQQTDTRIHISGGAESWFTGRPFVLWREKGRKESEIESRITPERKSSV